MMRVKIRETAVHIHKDLQLSNPLVGEPVTDGMTEHVGMDGEGKMCGLADARQEFAEAGCYHGCAALRGNDEPGGWLLPSIETLERSEFDAAYVDLSMPMKGMRIV